MAPTPDDSQLILRAVDGDQAAMERLLFNQYDRLHRHIARRIPSDLRATFDCDDILQQTYVEAFRDVGRFRPSTTRAFYRWLQTIAEHRLLDAIKSHQRMKRGGEFQRVEAMRHIDKSTVADLLMDIADGGETPSQIAVGREAVQTLLVQLAALPESYREVIRLRYLEGRSPEEVANTLERPIDAVRGLLYRAKKKLREGMGRTSLNINE